MAIDHDRLFKELIQTFFEEFILFVSPEAYEQIDFSYVTFLSEELFTDVVVGSKHRVDILVETKLKNDEEGMILIHVEPQSYYQPDFNERMFIYFSRLYEKHRKKILPIAIFSYDSIRNEPDTFQVTFPFLDVLNFRFQVVQLKKRNWRDFIGQPNPVAAALLSKMGYSETERVQVKIEFLRMITRLELDPAKTEMLHRFFEIYLPWSKHDEEELKQQMKTLNPEEEKRIMEYTISYEKKALEKVAKNLLAEGSEIPFIAKVTGLSEEEIKRLKQESEQH